MFRANRVRLYLADSVLFRRKLRHVDGLNGGFQPVRAVDLGRSAIATDRRFLKLNRQALALLQHLPDNGVL